MSLLEGLEACLALLMLLGQLLIVGMGKLKDWYLLLLGIHDPLPVLLLPVLEVDKTDEVREHEVEEPHREEEAEDHHERGQAIECREGLPAREGLLRVIRRLRTCYTGKGDVKHINEQSQSLNRLRVEGDDLYLNALPIKHVISNRRLLSLRYMLEVRVG